MERSKRTAEFARTYYKGAWTVLNDREAAGEITDNRGGLEK